MGRILTALLALVLMAAPAAAQPVERAVIDVALERGHMLRVLYEAPAQAVALAVLFPGGSGRVGIDGRGNVAFTSDFLVRSRGHWHAAGIGTATLDAPTYTRDLTGKRLELEYLRAIREVVLRLRKQTPAPIWLVGAAAGTVGAAAAAAVIPPGEIAGLVLTSPLTVADNADRSRETVFEVELEKIAVPSLVVVHAADRCAETPPTQAARLRSRLTAAPKATILTMTGGPAAADAPPCDARTPHGFLGLEVETVQSIAAQMAALSTPG